MHLPLAIFPNKKSNHHTVIERLTVMITTILGGDTGDPNSSSSPSSSSSTGTDSATNPLTESPSTLIAGILGAVGAVVVVLIIAIVIILVMTALRKRRQKAPARSALKVNTLA